MIAGSEIHRTVDLGFKSGKMFRMGERWGFPALGRWSVPASSFLQLPPPPFFPSIASTPHNIFQFLHRQP